MDLIKLFYTTPDDEINQLNNSSQDQIIGYILKQLDKIKKCQDQMYWKYDIDNGILSRLQHNSNLSEHIYLKINKLRESMWLNNNQYISFEEFIPILNENFN